MKQKPNFEGLELHIIDKLEGEKEILSDVLVERISSFIIDNSEKKLKENKTFTEEQIDILRSWYTPQNVKKNLENGCLIYFTNEKNEIVATGAIIKEEGRYELKYLNVREDYRERGIGGFIHNHRFEILRKLGTKEVYIYSAIWKGTPEFHKKFGFEETNDPPFYNLVKRMKKKL